MLNTYIYVDADKSKPWTHHQMKAIPTTNPHNHTKGESCPHKNPKISIIRPRSSRSKTNEKDGSIQPRIMKEAR